MGQTLEKGLKPLDLSSFTTDETQFRNGQAQFRLKENKYGKDGYANDVVHQFCQDREMKDTGEEKEEKEE